MTRRFVVCHAIGWELETALQGYIQLCNSAAPPENRVSRKAFAAHGFLNAPANE